VSATPAPAEIRALVNILDELDYYTILSVDRGAPASLVRQAYHAASRRFHPDLYRQLDPELRAGVSRIAKRVTEAYSVLRDPKRRQIYDRQIAGGGSGLRLQLAEAGAQAERKAIEERLGATPNGRRFFTLAHQEIDRGNLGAAARNLQMALTFEPTNAFFKQKLDEVRRQLR
jgi:DnaJ-class molecular chaperone